MQTNCSCLVAVNKCYILCAGCNGLFSEYFNTSLVQLCFIQNDRRIELAVSVYLGAPASANKTDGQDFSDRPKPELLQYIIELRHYVIKF